MDGAHASGDHDPAISMHSCRRTPVATVALNRGDIALPISQLIPGLGNSTDVPRETCVWLPSRAERRPTSISNVMLNEAAEVAGVVMAQAQGRCRRSTGSATTMADSTSVDPAVSFEHSATGERPGLVGPMILRPPGPKPAPPCACLSTASVPVSTARALCSPSGAGDKRWPYSPHGAQLSGQIPDRSGRRRLTGHGRRPSPVMTGSARRRISPRRSESPRPPISRGTAPSSRQLVGQSLTSHRWVSSPPSLEPDVRDASLTRQRSRHPVDKASPANGVRSSDRDHPVRDHQWTDPGTVLGSIERLSKER